MSKRKAYPLRINEAVLEAMQKWADDDLRSVNAQIEFVLRSALWSSGRLKKPGQDQESEATAESDRDTEAN
ncbi:MAG: Arc family DNA binding domain-containing protein [Pseudomonadota bacterium]